MFVKCLAQLPHRGLCSSHCGRESAGVQKDKDIGHDPRAFTFRNLHVLHPVLDFLCALFATGWLCDDDIFSNLQTGPTWTSQTPKSVNPDAWRPMATYASRLDDLNYSRIIIEPIERLTRMSV